MTTMTRKLIVALALVLALASCGEYNKVLKSHDIAYKYEYAKRAFEAKRYTQTYTILTDLVPVLKGSDKAEESLYLLALSYYENKDYINSGSYFKNYYQHYPHGEYAELARFYAGYGYYLDSPAPTRLLLRKMPFLNCRTNWCSRNWRTRNSITIWATTWATTMRAR